MYVFQTSHPLSVENFTTAWDGISTNFGGDSVSYYGYHQVNKQRIRAGELTGYHFVDNYPRIGEALVLEFSTYPPFRPIRPHKWVEYLGILLEWRKSHAESGANRCPA